jgi:hypothetical protein
MKMSNKYAGHTWEEVREKLFTPEEIAASDFRVALIGELIEARNKIEESTASVQDYFLQRQKRQRASIGAYTDISGQDG